MKRLMCTILILIIAFSICSCSKSNDIAATPKRNSTDIEAEEVVVDEFYAKMTQTKSRPVAIMIDNDSDAARPHTGIEDAFVIYEMMVEGTSTRLMALFLDSDAQKVGPVRSSRHYFLDYVMEHDAIYAHCGFSPQASSDIKAFAINNINEIANNNGKNFFRDKSKYAPHNLFASVPELFEYAKQKGYRTETEKVRVFTYRTSDENITGDIANKITLKYTSPYTVSYEYNEETKLYERYINGNPHTSTSSGSVLTAENIIVYNVRNYSIDDIGRQNLETVGTGNGYYLYGGKYIPITWTKNSRSEKTVYKTENGENLVLNPGNTYVQIVPVSTNIVIE